MMFPELRSIPEVLHVDDWFEHGMLALEKLQEIGIKFHVEFFGADLELDAAPFPFTNHGVLSEDRLAELYRDADIGVVFSGTNYSLIPQEMMSCGLPVVELETECTKLIFPDNSICLVKAHPDEISLKLNELLTNREKRVEQANNALAWVNQFEWEQAGRKVEKAFLNRLMTNERYIQLPEEDENVSQPLSYRR